MTVCGGRRRMFKHEIIYLLSLFWLLLKNVLFQIISYVIEGFMKGTGYPLPKLIHCQYSASCAESLSFCLCMFTASWVELKSFRFKGHRWPNWEVTIWSWQAGFKYTPVFPKQANVSLKCIPNKATTATESSFQREWLERLCFGISQLCLLF